MTPLLAAWTDFFSGEAIFDTIIWSTVIILLVVGFLGTFLPVLPGTTLIVIGNLLFYFSMGREASGLAWQGLVFVIVLYLLSILIDWVSGALGAKWFGSSKWGVIGAIVGGIVGIFFGLPGLIIGPIAGVFAFEIFFGKKQIKEASNSTVGTVVGGLAGIFARVILALGMVSWFVGDVFFVN
ncbi:MAG: DUF456 domain-containing protein [Verrucomicrobiales bacterium]|nr:DUF456 domain-containing protein [Verrucomicrobiales bacterium]MBP9224283.1 DUF456 domain-containing protein [Verrucomicrobiales bacterium]HQZ27438.1 DUF456 domain-containing protein [Verrucomicrobiales bacterium]